jgi:hypothetical protein
MGIASLATRKEIVEVQAVDDIGVLQKYVIAIPECDDVVDPNSCPGVNGRVIEPEVDNLLVLIVESYFGQDSCTKSKMWPLKSTLNFEYGGLSIVLLEQVNIAGSKTKKRNDILFAMHK